MSPKTSFTGHRRRRTTRWTVALSDRIARVLIAVGGIGTIVAVSLVCVFLVWVVVPLFLPAQVGPANSYLSRWSNTELLALGTDDYHLIGWMLSKRGAVQLFRLDNGEPLKEISAEEAQLSGMSCVAMATDGKSAMFGFTDGGIRLGRIEFDSELLELDQISVADRDVLAAAAVKTSEDGSFLTRTTNGEFRRQKFLLKLEPPVAVFSDVGVARLDFVVHGNETRFCARDRWKTAIQRIECHAQCAHR